MGSCLQPLHTANLQEPLQGLAQKGIMAGSHKIFNQQIKTYKTTLGHVTPPSSPA